MPELNMLDSGLKDSVVYCRQCRQYGFSEMNFCMTCGKPLMRPPALAAAHIDSFFLVFCIAALAVCAVLMMALNGMVALIIAGAAAIAACVAVYALRRPLAAIHEKNLLRRLSASSGMTQAHSYISDTVNRLELALAENNLPVFEKMLLENQHLKGLDAVSFLEAQYAFQKGDQSAAYQKCREAFVRRKGTARYVDLLNALAAAGIRPDAELALNLRPFSGQMDHPKYAPLLTAVAETEYDSPAADMRMLDLAIRYTDDVRFKLKRFYILTALSDPESLDAAYRLGMPLFDAHRNDKAFVEALVSVIKRVGAFDAASSVVVNHFYSAF